MSLDDTVPADGDGVTTGVKVSELAGHIRTLKTDLNDGKLSIIGDNDGDTYVTVEETVDEDVIHFYTAGSKRASISQSNLLTLYGADGNFNISASGAILSFSRPSANYIWANSESGYLLFGTNGRDLGRAYANLVLDPDQDSYFNGNVGIKTNDPDTMLTLGDGTNETYLKFNSERPWKFKADGSGGDTRLVLNSCTAGKTFVIQNAGTDKFRFVTSDGKAYADDSWNTFSPVLPDVKRYDWVEVAKEDAYKPRKPDGLTMNEMTDEDIEKYGKDIAKIAMANTRAIDYIAHVQRCILRSLINTRRMLYDIRQSATKKSIN